MEGGQKWSMLSYTGGSQDKTVINRALLRFRPIAPKPVAAESRSGRVPFDNKDLLPWKPRAKRKYVRVRKNNVRRKKKSSSPVRDEEASKDPENIVTLQLLPEKTEGNGAVGNQIGAVLEENQDRPLFFNLNFDNPLIDRMGAVEEPDRTVLISLKKKVTVVESWVTMECVTDSCMEGRELGGTDFERMKNLEANTCPGFITDGFNRVQWVNGAYKRMLTAGKGNDDCVSQEIMVCVVIKQELPRFCTAFSCKVRLQYTCQKEKCSRILPCDVWKMDCGGFAWRLDVDAALSLGR